MPYSSESLYEILVLKSDIFLSIMPKCGKQELPTGDGNIYGIRKS